MSYFKTYCTLPEDAEFIREVIFMQEHILKQITLKKNIKILNLRVICFTYCIMYHIYL